MTILLHVELLARLTELDGQSSRQVNYIADGQWSLEFIPSCPGGTCLPQFTYQFRQTGVTFGSPVPEPSTWLLLGSGLVGLILWRKRTA